MLIVDSGLKFGAEPLGPFLLAAAITGKPVMKFGPEASRPLMMTSVGGFPTAEVTSNRVFVVKPRRWSGRPLSTPLF